MFRFPFTNFHELNLDWILAKVKEFADLIPPMQSAVTDVQAALSDATEAIEKSEEALENANEAVETANEAKEIAEQAAQGTIPDGAVTSVKLANGAVTNTKISDNAVSSAKILDNAVTTSKINTSAVTNTKIADGAVTSGKLSDNAVTTDKINNGAVTKNKLSAELQTILDTSIITIAASIPIPAEGSSAAYTINGLTENHVIAFWGFSESQENSPPCDVSVTTLQNSFIITNLGGSTSESVKPVFIMPQ